MNQKAGLLFLSKNTGKIFLILDDQKWTVPTFSRSNTLLEDSTETVNKFCNGRILPIELYISRDNGFEYSTYVCLVEQEFTTTSVNTYAWCELNYLPKNLHTGLRNTLGNDITRTKIETILELENVEIAG